MYFLLHELVSNIFAVSRLSSSSLLNFKSPFFHLDIWKTKSCCLQDHVLYVIKQSLLFEMIKLPTKVFLVTGARSSWEWKTMCIFDWEGTEQASSWERTNTRNNWSPELWHRKCRTQFFNFLGNLQISCRILSEFKSFYCVLTRVFIKLLNVFGWLNIKKRLKHQC